MTRSSPKILVVDDDHNITLALWRRFKAVGIEVIRSHHGKEGMVLAMTEHPDVIITDYKMPGISGERFLMNLKYNDVTKNIPVIMVTGVTFDGVSVIPEFAGLAGCCVGLNQVNVRVPESTRSATDIPVVLTIDGKQSNTVTVAVERPQILRPDISGRGCEPSDRNSRD